MPATATVTDMTDHGYQGSTDLLARDVVAAFDAWAALLAPTAGVIDIQLQLVSDSSGFARGGGSAGGAVALGSINGVTIADSGAAFEFRTGHDPNGADPDIVIQLNVDFAAKFYWVNPLDGSQPPPGHTDLVSMLSHEIGHGFGINGYRDWSSFQLTSSVESPFDTLVAVSGPHAYFNGPNAMAAYGGPVPLTDGNVYHLGNANGEGGQLSTDLMNGFVLPFGTTPITSLDVAVLSDIGVPTNLADVLTGSSGSDVMFGGGGADTMDGGAGDDTIDGGADHGVLRGGDGNDSIVGGSGFDDINGNKGDDTISDSQGGDDWLVGGQGNDLISATVGGNILYGNLGNDTLHGGSGAEIIRGGQGDDSLTGGAGNDFLSGDRGNDTISGGTGADIFHTSSGAGIDRVTDFNLAEGDRVQVDAGTAWTVSQVGSDTVIDLGGGDQMVLANVQAASLTGDWIFAL